MTATRASVPVAIGLAVGLGIGSVSSAIAADPSPSPSAAASVRQGPGMMLGNSWTTGMVGGPQMTSAMPGEAWRACDAMHDAMHGAMHDAMHDAMRGRSSEASQTP